MEGAKDGGDAGHFIGAAGGLKMSEDDYCPDCEDTGLRDEHIGGGNVRKRFCDCAKGQEVERKDEAAKEEKDKWHISI